MQLVKSLVTTNRAEALQFQTKNPFGRKSEEIISRIMAKVQDGYTAFEVQKLQEVTDLQKLIQTSLGMNMFIVTTGSLAAVIPLYLLDSHIYKHKSLRKGAWIREQDVLAEKDQVGYVDDSDGSVGGIFSAYRCTLYLNFNAMVDRFQFSPEVIVGVMLHELGHYYDGCKTIAQRDRQNAVFREALSKLNTDNEGERIKVAYKVAKDLKLEQKDLMDLTNPNPVVFGMAAQKVITSYVAQQQEDGSYDRTSFETMADVYAARFGYSRQVVEGLSKLTKSQIFINYQFTMTLLAFENAMKATRALVVLLFSRYGLLSNMPLTYITSFILAIATSAYILYTFVKTSGESGKDFTYDDLSHRFRRLRAEMIAQVKDRQFTKADAEGILISLNYMSECMDEFKLRRGPIDMLFNILNPKDRRAYNAVERQRAIEELYSNPMVIKSLELELASAKV